MTPQFVLDTPRGNSNPAVFGRLAWLAAVVSACYLNSPPAMAAGAPSAISTDSLIREMTDLRGMAEFPNPAYTCKQFSSYDRKSTSPQDDWFANGDAGQYLRVEDHQGRKEFVMMDTAGPGAIVRIWSANPAGTLRVYLDGSETPALEAPMPDLLGGSFPGLPKPIAGEYSKGWNLYFPIAYARHCKVTSDQGAFYYHINYRSYPEGTALETFSLDQLVTLKAQIDHLASRLNAPRGLASQFDGDSEAFDLELGPGESVRQELSGPKAITRSVVRVSTRNPEGTLRSLILKVSFDGEPCIESPFGDFFGTGPGFNEFTTLPVGMTKDGEMYSNWYAPFRESAVIELVNLGKETVSISGDLVLSDYQWTERSMHLHAKWRSEFDVPTRPMQDWNYLTAHGKGVFAGVAFSIDNPVKAWWGEGDEKIYVDGESFPSHFGTGTEDYYGYAWCWPGLFTHAYHAQPRCDGPGNHGRTSVNRFHIIDRIPFNKDFKFDMELWHWDDKCKVNMAAVSYWYARPDSSDSFKPIRAQDVVVRPVPVYVVPRVAGALEGEDLKILQVSGRAEPQDWDGTSGGRHLWWHAGMKTGDTLTLSFPAPKAGKYRVMGRFLSARDYGTHQFAVNGEKAGEPRDFYNPDVKPGQEVELGVFDLKEKANEFSSTIVGANDKAVKSYMLGLDYLLLKPAQ